MEASRGSSRPTKLRVVQQHSAGMRRYFSVPIMIPLSTLHPDKARDVCRLQPWLMRWAMSPGKQKWAAANYRKYADGQRLKQGRVKSQDMPRLVVTDEWIIRVN